MQSCREENPATARWRSTGLRIRCALCPDEPRLLVRYLNEARQLAERQGASPWRIFEACLDLLLRSAEDRALPAHWRAQCLDYAYLPLQELRHHARSCALQRRLRALQWRLATLNLAPSLRYHDPEEGAQRD